MLFPELEIIEEVDGKAVIKEVIECLRILESAHPEQLQERITDKTYFDDFVGFAKQIAPDGKDIKTVSFRSAVEDNRALILRKKRSDIKEGLLPITKGEREESEPFSLSGYLMRASTPIRGKFGTVGLDSRELGERITIKVPIGYMKTAVQPHYEEMVVISGYQKDNKYYLEDIDKIDE